MNAEPYPIKTNDYKDDEILKAVMEHSNKCEYHTGFGDGIDVTLCAVLEIVDKLNHNGSVSVKLLQKELKALKGGEQG